MPASKSAEQTAGSLCQVIALAIAVIAAVHFALFGYFLYRTAITSPISDMFTYIADYLRFRAGEVGLLGYLWQPHGEHRLLWTRLLTWVDVELLHTRGFPFIAAATASIAVTATLLWHRLRRAEPMLGAPLTLLAPMLILTSANVTDCSVPINTTYPMTVFFVVSSIVLFAGVGARDRHSILQRTAALAAAIGAGFATAAGLLVWPILIWVGWRERVPYRWFAAVVGVGCAYVILYVHDLPPYGLAPALKMDVQSLLSPQHIWKLLDYFLGFVGLPLAREPMLAVPGRVVGAVLLLLGLSAVALASFSDRLAKPLDRMAVGLIMLAIGSAALAAVGRSELESEIPVRYTIFTSMLHVGLLYLLLPRCAQLFAAPRGQLLLNGSALVFAAVLLVQQILVGRIAERTAAIIARDADCFAQGGIAGPINPVVTRTPAGSAAVISALRQQGLLAPRATRCISP
jgi:hypothetical protein